MTKLLDNHNEAWTRVPFKTALDAVVQGDGTRAMRIKAGKFAPAPYGDRGWYERLSVPDKGRIIHIGCWNTNFQYGLIEAYYLATNSWELMYHFRDGAVTSISSPSSFVIDHRAYIFGGKTADVFHGPADDAYSFHPFSKTWVVRSGLPRDNHDPNDLQPPEPRIQVGAEAITQYGDRLGRDGIAFGGRSQRGTERWNWYNEMHRYNVALDTWLVVGAVVSSKRAGMSTTVLGGQLFSFGGYVPRPGANFSEDSVKDNQSFNPITETWTVQTDLQPLNTYGDWDYAPAARAHQTATSLFGNAHVFGGYGDKVLKPQVRHDTFHPAEKVWKVIQPTRVRPPYTDPDTGEEIPGWDDPQADFWDGFERNWGEWFPMVTIIDARLATMRGGIHLTGGVWGNHPWNEFWHNSYAFSSSSTHRRWAGGGWCWTEMRSSLVEPDFDDIKETMFQRPMGWGWQSVPLDGAPWILMDRFSDEDATTGEEHFYDSGHVLLTL